MKIHPTMSALQLSVFAKACTERPHRSYGGYCTSSVKLLNIFTLKRNIKSGRWKSLVSSALNVRGLTLSFCSIFTVYLLSSRVNASLNVESWLWVFCG